MSKRKQIEKLKAELGLLEDDLELAHKDYQHTHDTMWKLLTLLCEEFGMKLSIEPKPEPHTNYNTGQPCDCTIGGCR